MKFQVPSFKFQVRKPRLTWNLELETWNLFIGLRLELHAPAFQLHRVAHALAAQTLFQRLGLLRDHAMKLREGKIVHALAALSLRLDERVVEALHRRHVSLRVGAHEDAALG